jgi:hypothetical protein
LAKTEKSVATGKLGDIKGLGDVKSSASKATGGKAFDKESVTGAVSAETLDFLKVRIP